MYDQKIINFEDIINDTKTQLNLICKLIINEENNLESDLEILEKYDNLNIRNIYLKSLEMPVVFDNIRNDNTSNLLTLKVNNSTISIKLETHN